jgi:YbaB/EbfC DNA-binding family
MFDGRDLGDAERSVDDWQAGIEARATQARELSARLGNLQATVRSADESVTVTVGSTGDLVALDLTEAIRGRPATDTAQLILATLRTARRHLAEAVTTATDETIGADSATGRAVIASYARRMGDPDD